MAFKLYDNKSSVLKKHSRYVQGGDSTVDGSKIKWWERGELEKDDSTDFIFTITDVYAQQPDLIAFDYYNRDNLGWLVLQYNNIVDINTELVTGKVILLPSKDRVFYEILTKPATY